MASNTVFANKVIESKATELLKTLLDTRSLMTIDYSLEGHEGMKKTINTYTYSGVAEELAEGNKNTSRGSVAYVGKDYDVKVVQQVFDYSDEDFMKDSQVVDMGVKGMTEVMANFLNQKFYDALETDNGASPAVKLVGTTTFVNGGAISYDVIVDAISDMKVEDESKLVLLIPNEWKADLRKDDDYKSAHMGDVIYNGQVGTIAGIPVVATKLLDADATNSIPARAFLLTPEAVKLFVKKGTEVEQERDKEKRENTIILRDVYVCALVDATKARRIEEAAAE